MLIKQKKFIKQKEIEQTITIKKSLMDQVDEYISIAGIEHGIVRAGEAKATQEAKREFFIVEAIKTILEQDREEIAALRGSSIEEVSSEEVTATTGVGKGILDESISDLIVGLE